MAMQLSPQDHSNHNLEFTFEQMGDDLNKHRFIARPEGDALIAFTL